MNDVKILNGYPVANTTIFKCGDKEMIKISDEGFFVEGRKVTDDKKVYEGFKFWLETCGCIS